MEAQKSNIILGNSAHKYRSQHDRLTKYEACILSANISDLKSKVIQNESWSEHHLHSRFVSLLSPGEY
jgi:hypothetical protein